MMWEEEAGVQPQQQQQQEETVSTPFVPRKQHRMNWIKKKEKKKISCKYFPAVCVRPSEPSQSHNSKCGGQIQLQTRTHNRLKELKAVTANLNTFMHN